MVLQVTSDQITQNDRRFMNCPLPDEKLMSILKVPVEYAQFLRIVDQRENLSCVHYISYDVPEYDEQVMSVIGAVRGVIVDNDTGKVVCRSYPWTPEHVSYGLEKIPQDYDAFCAVEGTVLRVFWNQTKQEWLVSTHRRIDAAESRWGQARFKELFEELKTFDYNDLNKDLAYMFLESHPNNRFLYEVDTPQLMLITAFNKSTLEWERPELEGVQYPVKFASAGETVELETPERFDNVGFILVNKTGEPKPVKLMSPNYGVLKQVRGNEPSLRARYIQLRGTPESAILSHWFNEQSQVFANVEKDTERLVTNLYNLYVNHFIRKNITKLPKEDFVVLQRCHGWHREDPSKNRINPGIVRKMLNDTPPLYVGRMLKRLRQQDKRRMREKNTEEQTVENNDEQVVQNESNSE